MDFHKFKEAARKAKGLKLWTGVLLALDPGETTGWSVWQSTETSTDLLLWGQEPTWPMLKCVPNMTKLFTETSSPTYVVYEQYRVYQWRAEEHTWSSVPTLQIIGCIEMLCVQQGLPPPHTQTAQLAKHFCTDDKLRQWGFYSPGQKHARDSIRHGAYALLFHPFPQEA